MRAFVSFLNAVEMCCCRILSIHDPITYTHTCMHTYTPMKQIRATRHVQPANLVSAVGETNSFCASIILCRSKFLYVRACVWNFVFARINNLLEPNHIIYLSICLSVCLSACLSACLPVSRSYQFTARHATCITSLWREVSSEISSGFVFGSFPPPPEYIGTSTRAGLTFMLSLSLSLCLSLTCSCTLSHTRAHTHCLWSQ